MISFSNLPELVIHHILEYKVRDGPYLEYNLPYLAICHSWRHVALPLVYKTAFILNSYNEEGPQWNSNIGLLLSTGYCSFAQRLEIAYPKKDKLTVGELESLLNILSPRPVQWPAHYQQQLVYLNETGTQYILGKNQLQIVEKTVGQFAQRFTGIKELRLDTSSKNDISRQIVTTLVDAFASQLHSLHDPHLNGGSLTHSLDNLTSLWLWCDMKSYPLFSIVNILPLEKLGLCGNLVDFSWGFFRKDPRSNEPVVFPNLEVLQLSFEHGTRFDYTHAGGLYGAVPIENIGVKFPKLQKLYFIGHKEGFVFQPELISSHLHTADLCLTGDTFIMFSKLPIKSINFLHVDINEEPSNMSEFYTAANHFFKNIKNHGRTSVVFDCVDLKEARQMDWPNIGHMDLGCTDMDDLFNVINSIPQITELYVSQIHDRESKSQLRWSPDVSKLEKFSLYKEEAEDWDATLCEIIEMLKSLTNLRKLRVRGYKADDIREKINGLSKEDYPHFKDFEIAM